MMVSNILCVDNNSYWCLCGKNRVLMKRLFGGAGHKKGLLAIWKGIFAKIAGVKEWKTLDFCNINLICNGIAKVALTL